jgi:prepilin-type N-terminal cleavage/methylation domain-containing protein
MDRGFSLVELLVVVAIIAVLMGIMVPIMQSAMLRAHVGAMSSDARVVQTAFKQFFVDYDMYPHSVDAPAFELDTFEPLVSGGYYDGDVVARLINARADAYDSPDDRGINQEFWVEMTLAYDPSVRFLIADSDNAPLSGGDHMDGIFLYKNGVLHALTSPVDR